MEIPRRPRACKNSVWDNTLSWTAWTRVRMDSQELFHEALSCLADFLRASDVLVMPSHSNLGKYEADLAAMSLVRLCGSNAWGVHDLGAIGMARYPAAAACARCAFEIGAVAAWLLIPDDPFEREGRWLGWFKSNERFYANISNDLRPLSPELADSFKKTSTHYSKWRTSIEAKLPGGKVIEKPAIPNILRELDFLSLYATYRGLSQVTHAEPGAMGLVHKVEYVPRNQSTKELIFEAVGQTHFWGSFIDESHWAIPIHMAAWGLMVS